VVAHEPEALAAGAEPDLGVEDPVALVPDLVQPAQAVAGLGGQGAVAAVQAAPDEQHLRRRVGGRVGELDEVAGVEPAALDVHRAADPLERGRRHVAAVAFEHRGGVHGGVAVGQVGGARPLSTAPATAASPRPSGSAPSRPCCSGRTPAAGATRPPRSSSTPPPRRSGPPCRCRPRRPSWPTPRARTCGRSTCPRSCPTWPTPCAWTPPPRRSCAGPAWSRTCGCSTDDPADVSGGCRPRWWRAGPPPPRSGRRPGCRSRGPGRGRSRRRGSGRCPGSRPACRRPWPG
jgi:hypothetical protein